MPPPSSSLLLLSSPTLSLPSLPCPCRCLVLTQSPLQAFALNALSVLCVCFENVRVIISLCCCCWPSVTMWPTHTQTHTLTHMCAKGRQAKQSGGQHRPSQARPGQAKRPFIQAHILHCNVWQDTHSHTLTHTHTRPNSHNNNNKGNS